jgi:RNA polymerase sigma-70 factor (ECF subfamily)
MLTDEERKRYEQWVLAVGPRALAYARSLIQNPVQAEDVVQECLYRLLRRSADYDLERDGIKLLFKAISNLCINQVTRNKEILSLDADSGANSRSIPVPDSSSLRPDQILQYRELEEKVRRSIQNLPPLQRAAVELRSLGMSKEEIGEALGVSTSNAGVLVHRGRQTLARELGLQTGEGSEEV